ncbi:hypothetical protein HDU91_002137 [Kappamyces sp. JEL0680]|nr:hypothetical protein HDU91_002137 [Kappamyces sp. JEL0680]
MTAGWLTTGQCKFGNNCKFEHTSGGFGRPSNPPGNSAFSVAGKTPAELLKADLTTERPIWPLSCYGFNARGNAISGTDLSPEEVHWLFVEEMKRSNQTIQAAAKVAQMAQQVQFEIDGIMKNAAWVLNGTGPLVRPGSVGGTTGFGSQPSFGASGASGSSPFRSAFGAAAPVQSAFGTAPVASNASAFGSTGFGTSPASGQPAASSTAFGTTLPSSFGGAAAPVSAFGTPSAAPSAFGAPAQPLGSFSAFSPAKPSAFGASAAQPSGFGVPSQSAFGNASAFAASSQPPAATSAFGTTGFGASASNAAGPFAAAQGSMPGSGTVHSNSPFSTAPATSFPSASTAVAQPTAAVKENPHPAQNAPMSLVPVTMTAEQIQAAFSASKFTLGLVPELPPPKVA